MKTIQPATERKLLDCISKTTGYVSDGMSPNDAIVKAASDTGVRPGEISLVVHAFNTGRTSQQRADGQDLFEKTAEFELADLPAILEQLYPTTVKTAAAKEYESVISDDYSYSPRPMLERHASREKAASVIDWRAGLGDGPVTAPPAYPRDEQAVMRKAAGEVDRLKRAVEENRRQAANAFDQMGRTFTDLTEYFRRPGSKPMPVVKEAVILLHGSKGEQIMDQLIHVTPGLTKFANHVTERSMTGLVPGKMPKVADLDCGGEPFTKIAQLVQEIDTYKQLKAIWMEAHATSEKQAEVLLGPFAEPCVSPSILGPSSTEEGQLKLAFNPMSALGSYTLLQKAMGDTVNKLKPPDDDKLVNKALTDLTDPAHEAKIQGINTQAMLQDMLLNDPVISGYDPTEVTQAYNDITQLAPHAADQRMLMQALMRKQLQQGQLDQFDMDQMLGMENKLLARTQSPMSKAPMNGVAADGSVI